MEKELILIKNLLKKHNCKFTKQKKLIFEELFKSNTHQNVKEIYEKVKSSNIGLATVYRTVNIFKQAGIVKEINVNGASYYELKIYSKKPLHIHFKCIRCNSIIDIDNSKVNLEYIKINNYIEKTKNIDIFDVNTILVGLCSKCREDNKCQDQ
ncbi:Fur family transcriptional regulator [Clostridium polyendosporum]|nr:transcriptional repressor [Clostridium polyendosporum]